MHRDLSGIGAVNATLDKVKSFNPETHILVALEIEDVRGYLSGESDPKYIGMDIESAFLTAGHEP